MPSSKHVKVLAGFGKLRPGGKAEQAAPAGQQSGNAEHCAKPQGAGAAVAQAEDLPAPCSGAACPQPGDQPPHSAAAAAEAMAVEGELASGSQQGPCDAASIQAAGAAEEEPAEVQPAAAPEPAAQGAVYIRRLASEQPVLIVHN